MDTHEQFLDEILENDPSPETVYRILARRKGEERPERTIQRCRQALKNHPNHMGLRSLLADAYLDSGLAARAVEELERMTTAIDGMASAYDRLAEVYARQKRTPEAIRCMEIYLAHHPEDRDARERLNQLLPEEVSDTGETDLEEWAEDLESEVSDEFPEIATPTLAELYVNQGQIETAIQTYRKVLEQYPEDGNSRSRLEELEFLQRREQADVEPSPQETGGSALEQPTAFDGEMPPQAEATEQNPEKRKHERMIAILETWLARLHEPRSELSS